MSKIFKPTFKRAGSQLFCKFLPCHRQKGRNERIQKKTFCQALGKTHSRILDSIIYSKNSPNWWNLSRMSAECQQNVSRMLAESQKNLRRISADSQQTLSRISAESQQILSRISADSQQTISRLSADSQQTLSTQQ